MLNPNEAADMIHAHGVDKVLFGTDYPMRLHEEEFTRFCKLPLTEAEREAILHKNAEQLLQIEI
jgi:predicted TIM-barrel fold metal-dependent hydrolase